MTALGVAEPHGNKHISVPAGDTDEKKAGDTDEKKDGEIYRRQISQMLGGATIYLLNETVEMVPGADFDPESMREEILK